MNAQIRTVISQASSAANMSQDAFGAKYPIIGPSVHKFENGLIVPEFNLWMKMARDAGLSQWRAVVLWARDKLAADYEQYFDLDIGERFRRMLPALTAEG